MSKPFDMATLKTVLKDVWKIVSEQKNGERQDNRLPIQNNRLPLTSPSSLNINSDSNDNDNNRIPLKKTNSKELMIHVKENDIEKQIKKSSSLLDTLRASDSHSSFDNISIANTRNISKTSTHLLS